MGREYRATTWSALLYKEVTDRELNKVLKALEQIPNEKDRTEAMEIVLRAASESITLERLKRISSFREEEKKKEDGQGYVKFTKKEIESMPDYLKKLFAVNDKIITCRYIKGMYQARYRRDGFNIEVANKDFGMMKLKFLEKFKKEQEKKE